MDQAHADTICAIATPSGEGGVGIVRLSGPDAVRIAARITRLRSGRPLASVPSHSLHLADIGPTDWSGPRPGTALDEGYVARMAAPRSYTAEDVVELHCHGSAVVLGRVCAACVAAGARLAQPGEFTKRAFLNGRIDLSQAEAVLDTIRATTDAGLRLAQEQLRGRLGEEVSQLRQRLLTMLAHVEAGIDFAEEPIEVIDRRGLADGLRVTDAAIHQMLATCQAGRRLREGARVVIAGRPNVGKSSLLNRLLQEERAIVTDIPGTTRDVIEEAAVLDGWRVTLIDTAGLRETRDEVERRGIERARAAQRQADLVLWVCDVFDEAGLLEAPQDDDASPVLVVLNKIDLMGDAERRIALERIRGRSVRAIVAVSAVTGAGMPELKHAIHSALLPGGLEARPGVMVTNARHQGALNQAAAALRRAAAALEEQVALECVAVDVRQAADALGEITGAITTSEILDRIFSEFCIGK